MSGIEEEKKESFLLERLIKSRSIVIAGEINQKLVERVSQQLLILAQESGDPITIYLNTQGGHVESGDSIHDLIRFVKPKVRMVGTGWVASAGITIYLAADKEERYSFPNTRYMIHQPMGGTQGQASDIQIEAKEIVKMRKRINKLIANRTERDIKKVEVDTERNFWMSPTEAMEYGIVNKIIQSQGEL